MYRFLLLAAFAVTFTACDSGSDTPLDLTVQTATEIAADPAQRDQNTGQVLGQTNQFTLFSLRTGDVVVNYDAAERADSASTRWDIGFRGSEIILNGGASGPGAAVGLIVEDTFTSVTDAQAPSYSYRRDGESECPDVQTPVGPQPGRSLAVCTGSGNGWFTYVPFTGTPGGYAVPTPGRTLLVRLADNSGYAKVNFLNYYQGRPEPSEITSRSADRYYTFEYVVTDQTGSFVAEMM